MAMVCTYHPDREAVGACVNCGHLICDECKTVLGGRIYCSPCADKMFATRAETGIDRTEAGVLGAENTSGQGSLAVIPREIGGWNWGAFLLNWIWAIGNSVWIGLLGLIPLVGFVMSFVLGAMGNEWAWRYKRWDSVEHFKRTQRTWTKWGIIIVPGSIAFCIITFTIIMIIVNVTF